MQAIVSLEQFHRIYTRRSDGVLCLMRSATESIRQDILAYRVLADMGKDDQLRYQHFYEDALLKAKDKVRLQFLDLKKERKVVTSAGIAPSLKRLKAFLTSVFESIYPKAVPFDFDGFNTKSTSGAGYKNFCSIMKWILIDHMAYTSLKSQSVEVRNRVESVLGMNGAYSWRALNDKYKGVQPNNPQAGAIYATLDSLLNEKKVIPFKKIVGLLTAAPYGMNEYATFMLLGLFSENLSYTTKLEMDGYKYNTEAWADEVLQDKKYDAKAFGKTRLVLVDVGETTAKFRYLYKQIKDNTDFTKAESLQAQLNNLKKEESVPEALEAEDTLATMYLGEAARALRTYNDRTGKIDSYLRSAERSKNPYSALKGADEAEKIICYPPSRFQYSSEQMDELNGYIAWAKKIAQLSFEDGWIKYQCCSAPDQLLAYQNFSTKAGELFNHYGFTKEACELSDQVSKEVERIKLVIAQEALYKNSVSFIADSIIRPGLTKKVLTEYQKQGQTIVKEYENFDYTKDKSFTKMYEQLQKRLSEVANALLALKQQQDALWDAIYGIETVDDVRHIVGQIQALLGTGLADDDREDFERIDSFLRQFLSDINSLMNGPDSREEINSIHDNLLTIYNEDSELSMEELIERITDDQYQRIAHMEQEWTQQYLAIDLSLKSQSELDSWKRETQPLPGFISEETKNKYATKLSEVEEHLSRVRKEYIMFLFEQLSDSEKADIRKLLL